MKALRGVELCLHSLISTLDGVGDHSHALTAFRRGKRLGAPCAGGQAVSRAGLDGCEKYVTPTEIRSPGLPARDDSLFVRIKRAYRVFRAFSFRKLDNVMQNHS
jgi:hypothetical protein